MVLNIFLMGRRLSPGMCWDDAYVKINPAAP